MADERSTELLRALQEIQRSTSNTVSGEDTLLAQLQSIQNNSSSPQPVQATESSFFRDVYTGFSAIGQNLTADVVNSLGGNMGRVEVPNTVGGRVGNVAPTYLAIGTGLGALATQVPRVPLYVQGIQPVIQNAVSSIGQMLTRNPVAFSSYEALASSTSAAGGFYAEQLAPDSPAARFIGEILGGFAPAGAAAGTNALVRGATNLPLVGAANRFVRSVTGRSVIPEDDIAVQRRISRATEERGQALQNMTDDFIEGLTPAAKSGDEGLLRLEAAVNQRLEDSHKFINSSFETVQRNMREAISGIEAGQGTSEDVVRLLQDSQRMLSDTLDEGLRVAALETERRLSQLTPQQGREQANIIVAEELQSALSSARQQESALYALIPSDAPVPTTASQTTLNSFRSELAQAQLDDIPRVALRFLDNSSGSFLGDITTIKELRGLQSSLRAEARNARSGTDPNFNRARIADAIADSISNDLSSTMAGEEVSNAVNTAVAFSRKLNQTYHTGTVGRILRRDAAGTQLPEGLFLENTLGIGNPAKAREAFDDIMRATGDSQAVRDATISFISQRFMNHVMKPTGFNVNAASAFLRDNDEVLRRLPELRTRIEQAINAGNTEQFAAVSQRTGMDFINNPNKSLATMFIQRSPEQAFDSVLRSPNPVRAMRDLVEDVSVGGDTGERALSGLRSSFTDYLFRRVSDTATGNISGARLNALLNEREVRMTLRTLYTPEQAQRWETIARTANRLELQRRSAPSAEGVIEQGGNMLTNILAGISGARFGSAVSRTVGGGGIQIPQIFASNFRKLVDIGINPQRRLLEDAVQNEELFKRLLSVQVNRAGNVVSGQRDARFINAWALGVLAQAEYSAGRPIDLPSEYTDLPPGNQ